MKEQMKDSEIVKKIDGRRAGLKLERSSFDAHWQDIARFMSPRTSRFTSSDRNKGDKLNGDIINETVMFARRTLQSGLMAGMSSPSRPWFLLGPPDPGMKEFKPVKEWLDDVTRIMREMFLRSNLYSILPRAYGAYADYGTSAFGVLEDDQDGFRCYPFPVGSFMLDCDERMKVDTFYREYDMTVRQLVHKFGKENCSSHVQNLWDRSEYATWISVVHAVEPNFQAIQGSISKKDKPFISVYYELMRNEGKALRVSGFDDFPALAPRWYVNGEDVYGGECPGMLALGSVKALQLEERRKYQALDKFVRPTMNVDASLKNTGAAFLPGGVNYIPGLGQMPHAAAKPAYEINANILNPLKEDIKEVEYRIQRAYYEDIMLILARGGNQQKTAREIDELSEEKFFVLGPLMEQGKDDLFDPLIDRAFNIGTRKGMFPPPPEELQGQPLKVEYTSIMAQAQKLIGVATIERFAGFVGNLEALKPGSSDKFDADQAIDEYADMTGVPARIVISDAEVLEIRESRAAAAQAQQMAQAMPAVSQGAQAAKTLSETDTEGVSALSKLLTGAGVG